MNSLVRSLYQPLSQALRVMLMLTVLTGVMYPLLITAAAQLFPHQAQGSLVHQTINGQTRVVGSELIGQSFTEPGYFWSRPSATTPTAYNAEASGGSNLGPLNPALLEAVKTRVAALKAADPDNTLPIPVDLVTASASGLDPHISLAAAQYQSGRVAKARGLQVADVQALIAAHQSYDWFTEPHVNVLSLNMAMDELQTLHHSR